MNTLLGRAARSNRFSAEARVTMLSASLATAAVALMLVAVRPMDTVEAPVHLSWVVIAVLSAISEIMVVHLESRREAHTVSFSDIPLTIGLILANPFGLVFGRLIGAGLTLVLYRRQPPRKIAFNLSLFALETVVALLVFQVVLDGASPIEPGGWPAAFVAVLVANILGSSAVTAVITLSSGTRPPRELVRRALLVSTVTGLVNAAIGIGIVAALWNESAVFLLFVPVALGVYFVNRSYVDLSQRHRSVESLHTFAREVGGSLELEPVGAAVLRSACELLRCERADLVLLGPGGASHRSYDQDRFWSELLGELDLPGALQRYVPGGTAAFVDPTDPTPSWMQGAPYRDAVAAPIVGSNGPFGLLLVGDRMSDVRRFDDDDLASFTTLVSHASKALENSRLFEQIQQDAADRTYQALHDALTGLPNRHSLEEDLPAVLEAAEATGEQVALLLIDLECFKEVNDTLGHQAGDRLLCRVSDRFRETAGERESVYRFGGDEFIVVQRAAVDRDDAVDLAERLRASLDLPFEHDDLSIAVSASIGVAVFPDHATDSTDLVKRADVAMYVAKGSRSGIEMYAPERDPFSPRRLAVAGQLRGAIHRREITVLYQPKVDLKTNEICGLEALVRWRHPRFGLLGPDEFVPAAERNGAIQPLTREVLEQAVWRCREWRDLGMDLSVAVNLSVHSLLDHRLVSDIRQLLDEAQLPAGALVIELTESSVLTESRRALTILGALDELGVELSVDDFGTGYSSLVRLRGLPISEIKIDRSFIADLDRVPEDAAIVGATIQLGHRLGLNVVAEGIETYNSLERVRHLHCDVAQGFLISPPRTARDLESWLLAAPGFPVRRQKPPGAVPPAARIPG